MPSVQVGLYGHAMFSSTVWHGGTASLQIDSGASHMQLSADAVQLNALSELLTDTLAAMRGEAPEGEGCSDEYDAILRSFTTAKSAPNRADLLALITKLGWLTHCMDVEGSQAVTDHLDAAYEALLRCHADSADDVPLQADMRLDMAERAR